MNTILVIAIYCCFSNVMGAIPGARKAGFEHRIQGYEDPRVQGHLPRLVRVVRPHDRHAVPTYRQRDGAILHPDIIDYHQQAFAVQNIAGRHHPNAQLRPVIGYGRPRRVLRRRIAKPVHTPRYARDPIYTAAQGPDVSYADPQPQNDDYQQQEYGSKPYEFGYDTTDENGNNMFRKESSDDKGTVIGSYGYRDAYGVYRTVEYTADDYGFRAKIKSNEPGTSNQAAADTEIHVEPPPQVIQEKASAPRVDYAPIRPVHPQDRHGVQARPLPLRDGPANLHPY